jgi:hypothetical protein
MLEIKAKAWCMLTKKGSATELHSQALRFIMDFFYILNVPNVHKISTLEAWLKQ